MPRHNIVSWAATQKRPQWLQFKALAEHLWIHGSNEIGCAAVGLFKWCSQKGLQQYVKRCVAMYHFCNVWTTLQTINCPLDKNNTNTSLTLMRREPSKAWFVKLILMWHSFSESSLLGTSELMEAAPTVFELSPSDIQKYLEVSDTGTWSDEDVGQVVSNKSEHLDCNGIVSNLEMSFVEHFWIWSCLCFLV